MFLFAILFIVESSLTYRIMIVSCYLFLVLFRYEFHLYENKVSFETRWIKLLVFRKRLQPEQIEKISFKRVGWSSKCAIIRVKGFFRIRLILFEPAGLYEDLERFAINHQIPIEKTKDYELLIKYYT